MWEWIEHHIDLNQLYDVIKETIQDDNYYTLAVNGYYNPVHDTQVIWVHIMVQHRFELQYKFVLDLHSTRIKVEPDSAIVQFLNDMKETVHRRVYRIINPENPVKHSPYKRATKYRAIKYKPKKGNYLVKRKKVR